MSEPYAVAYGRAARRALMEKLPMSVSAAVFEFVEGTLANNPHRVGSQLREPFSGQWRARRGEYRVRYRIDEDRRTILINSVEHRRDAYRC